MLYGCLGDNSHCKMLQFMCTNKSSSRKKLTLQSTLPLRGHCGKRIPIHSGLLRASPDFSLRYTGGQSLEAIPDKPKLVWYGCLMPIYLNLRVYMRNWSIICSFHRLLRYALNPTVNKFVQCCTNLIAPNSLGYFIFIARLLLNFRKKFFFTFAAVRSLSIKLLLNDHFNEPLY